jgi:hypothetical protein
MDPVEKLRADLDALSRDLNQEKLDRAVLQERVANLKDDVDAIPSKYVTHEDFGPVKKIVFGLVGAVLMLFFTALGAIVFGQGSGI